MLLLREQRPLAPRSLVHARHPTEVSASGFALLGFAYSDWAHNLLLGDVCNSI